MKSCTCSNECKCDTFQIGECDFCCDRKCQKGREIEELDCLWQAIAEYIPKHQQKMIRDKYNELIENKGDK